MKNVALLPKGYKIKNTYKIIDYLGQGNFGITYKCFNSNLNSYCAVKELYPRELVNLRTVDLNNALSLHVLPKAGLEKSYKNFIKRFQEEAKNLKRFHEHPNIVRVNTIFTDNNTVYMEMEYYPGLTLMEWLNKYSKQPLDERIVYRHIIEPLCGALNTMHDGTSAKPVIHRDVKPNNIFLKENKTISDKRDLKQYQPILLDFGNSRNIEHSKQPRTSAPLLTHGFAPPEQYTTVGKQGAFTDVYAIAAVYYTVLFGKIPPSALDRQNGQNINFGSRNISSKICEVISTGMELDVNQRYQTISEFVVACRKSIKPNKKPNNHIETKVDSQVDLPTVTVELPKSQKKKQFNLLPFFGVLIVTLLSTLGYFLYRDGSFAHTYFSNTFNQFVVEASELHEQNGYLLEEVQSVPIQGRNQNDIAYIQESKESAEEIFVQSNQEFASISAIDKEVKNKSNSNLVFMFRNNRQVDSGVKSLEGFNHQLKFEEENLRLRFAKIPSDPLESEAKNLDAEPEKSGIIEGEDSDDSSYQTIRDKILNSHKEITTKVELSQSGYLGKSVEVLKNDSQQHNTNLDNLSTLWADIRTQETRSLEINEKSKSESSGVLLSRFQQEISAIESDISINLSRYEKLKKQYFMVLRPIYEPLYVQVSLIDSLSIRNQPDCEFNIKRTGLVARGEILRVISPLYFCEEQNTYIYQVVDESDNSVRGWISANYAFPIQESQITRRGINDLRSLEMGETLVLPAGIFSLDESIELPRNVTIVGEDISSTIIVSTANDHVISHEGSSNSTLRLQDLTIARSGTSRGVILEIMNSRVEFDSIRISGDYIFDKKRQPPSSNNGIYLNGVGQGSYIKNSVIRFNPNDGIYLENSNIEIENNIFAFNYGSSVSVNYGSKSLIRNNSFNDGLCSECSSDIFFTTPDDNIVLENNYPRNLRVMTR